MTALALAGDGGTIHYQRIAGAADRPCLVFLHEGLGCVAMWKDFPQRLCATTGCAGLLYDRIGYGHSSPLVKPRSIHYLHEYALIELPQVLAQLLPDRDYVVIGHSDGGSIGLIHSAARPERLRALITIAAHSFVEPETLAGIDRADAAFASGKLKAALTRHHGDKTEATFRAWADTWRADWYAGWNIESVLPAIACPTLIVQGEADEYASRAQVDRPVALIPGAEGRLLPGLKHSPHLEAPDTVVALATAFLAASGVC